MALGFFPKAENFAEQIVVHGCARPWFVYVKTFVPAFLKLVLTITLLDLEDILRDYAKQKVFEGGSGSGRNIGHRYKPRVSNQATKTQRFSQKGLKTLLIITEPLEIIGFAWLLYSAGDQFFYDWQLLLERSIFCSDSGLAGPLQRARTGGFNIGITPGGTITPLPIIQQNRANWTTTAISVSVPFGSYKCIFAVTVEGPLGGISDVKCRLRLPFGTAIFIESEPAEMAQGETATLIAEGDFFTPTGGNIVWELSGPAVPVGLLCDGGCVIVMANEI